MKVSFINGSPKLGTSTSELMITYLTPFIKENEISIYNIRKMDLSEMQFGEITRSEVLIFAFPLYVDSIPSHLLRFLVELERRGFPNKNIIVYSIINNGFFEGKQNHIASNQMKNWCKSVGLTWGQTIGVGAGEMLPYLKNISLGQGPNKNIGRAVQELDDNIMSKNTAKDLFVSPNWPRFLWKIQSSLYFWYPRGKKNGVKRSRLKEKVMDKEYDNKHF